MDAPAISVIIPTRGRPEFLREAVASVLAQRLPATEVLVVDDGGEGEAAGALAARLGEGRARIRVLRGPGRGPGAARNVGLREAVGELVAFLDDDDVWLPGKLASQAGWFVRCPRLGLVGTDCLRRGDLASVARGMTREARRLRRVSRSELVRANRLVTSSVMARRECFEECGEFEESLLLAQDWDVWLRIAARWEVGIVASQVTIYRLHGEQRSGDRMAMRRWEAEVLRREVNRGELKRGWREGVARRRLGWAHCRLGRLLAREGEMERAVEELEQAVNLFRCHPVAWAALARCALGRWVHAEAQRQ